MNKKILFLGITALIALPALAELTTDDVKSTSYLKNHGHSTAIINVVQHNTAQVNGEEYTEPVEKEYYNEPKIKFLRRLWEYVDPALDDHSFMNHDIKTTPRWDDL